MEACWLTKARFRRGLIVPIAPKRDNEPTWGASTRWRPCQHKNLPPFPCTAGWALIASSRAFRKFVTSYFGICSTAQVAVGRAYLYRMAKLTYHGLTKRCTSKVVGV